MSTSSRWLWLAAVAGLLVVTRTPLFWVTHSLPLSNDDALCVLTAQQVLEGEESSTPWNQDYNGTLDSYLLAPWLWVFPPLVLFGAYLAVGGLVVVWVIGCRGGRLAGATAGWWAALLAACGTPYMALMGATGPIPNFITPLLVGAAGAAVVARLPPDGPPLRLRLAVLWGVVCALSVWNTALALPALAGIAAGAVVAGARPRLAWLGFPVGGLIGSLPALLGRLVGASGHSVVAEIRPVHQWPGSVFDLLLALSGLLGLEVPQVIDGPERDLLPVAMAALLGLALSALVVLGSLRRKAWPALGWALASCSAFVLSQRSGGDEVRYVFGVAAPVLALAGVGLLRVWRIRPTVAAALALAVLVPWGAGHVRLFRRWRDPDHATRVWQVPPLGPVVSTLERVGVRSAYATLQVAGRLALECGGRVVVSQAWNERLPGDPLRFRDEVDLDPAAAWVLSPHISRGMPRARGFRALLGELGGSWKEDRAGDFVVFRRFQPPFDERRPVAADHITATTLAGETLPEAVLDRDPETAWQDVGPLRRGRGLEIQVAPRRRLSALVLILDLERSPLAVPWSLDLEDEMVAHGPARFGMQWVAGVPRGGKQALLTIPLAGRDAGRLRLVFQGNGPPLSVSELLLYGPDEPPLPERGVAAAAAGLAASRSGRWHEAVARYAEALLLEPHRASRHAALARARWRADRRQWLDVESLDDGGRELVGRR